MSESKQFDFKLPKELIAQSPAVPRDSARLLVFNQATGEITDAVFKDIGDFLPKNSTLVVNNAKVDKDRLRFGNIEIFILETHNDKQVTALVRPGKKFKPGKITELVEGVTFETHEILSDGQRRGVFNVSLDEEIINRHRLTPLPPYIAQDESLSDEYQTVYAKEEGSKAAPTAGLHFTDELIEDLKNDHDFQEVTLNVGLGTFAALTEENIKNKTLHAESYFVSDEAAKAITSAEHVTAVGTTSVRVLESTFEDGIMKSGANSTEIFIQPGYKFKRVNSLITNFHLPGTSLLMLVASLTGEKELEAIYAHAIKQKYRFYSFGDAMLVV